MTESAGALQGLYKLLGHADETYANLPPNVRLQVDKISQGLAEFGPRKLKRKGIGTEFFESRDFRPGADEPRRINARLSARAGRPVVVEQEAEIRQHFYLWRDPSESMNFSSREGLLTKKQAAEVMLLSFARHLSKNDELIGVLDRKGQYRGGKAHESIAHHLVDVSIMTGDMPSIGRKLPRNSTAALFGDFMMSLDSLKKGLLAIDGVGLKGYVVMVLDPQEIDFDYDGATEFEGLEGEGKISFTDAGSLKEAWSEKITQHIRNVEKLAAARGFKFILQRTDEPLYHALFGIYGLSPKAPVITPGHEL